MAAASSGGGSQNMAVEWRSNPTREGNGVSWLSTRRLLRGFQGLWSSPCEFHCGPCLCPPFSGKNPLLGAVRKDFYG